MSEYESLSAGDEWLKRYTYDNVGICPEEDIVRELLSTYPFEGGTLYRGLNFLSSEAWEAFLTTTNGGTLLESHAVTSWAKEEFSARQFAVTRPSYHLDSITKDAEAEKRTNQDYMLGHAGAILKITVPANVACDVTKSRYAKEDEVILPAGTYKIELQQVLRPYMQTITTENYVDEIMSIKSLIGESDGRARFNHIVNRFSDFTDQARGHIFGLITEGFTAIDVDVVRTDPPDAGRRVNKKMTELFVGWNFPSDLFKHYDKFLPDDQARVEAMLRHATATMDATFKEITRDMDWTHKPFVMLIDQSVAEAIGTGRITPEFPATVNSGIGRFYQHMNSIEVTSAITTRNEHHDHAKLIGHALSQMIRNPKAGELQRAKAAAEAVRAEKPVKAPSP